MAGNPTDKQLDAWDTMMETADWNGVKTMANNGTARMPMPDKPVLAPPTKKAASARMAKWPAVNSKGMGGRCMGRKDNAQSHPWHEQIQTAPLRLWA